MNYAVYSIWEHFYSLYFPELHVKVHTFQMQLQSKFYWQLSNIHYHTQYVNYFIAAILCSRTILMQNKYIHYQLT